MAFVHGRDAYIAVADSGGVLRDISAYCDQVSLSISVESAETTVFTKDSKTYVPGLRDQTISISGKFDSTVDGYLSGILQSASREFAYGPTGNQTPKYSGNGTACGVVLTSYEISAGVGDVITFSAELQITDAPTRS